MAQELLYKLKPQRILNLIQTQNLKLWWVAELAGVHKTTLRRWLRGHITRANAIHVRRLAAVLHTPMHVICDPQTERRSFVGSLAQGTEGLHTGLCRT